MKSETKPMRPHFSGPAAPLGKELTEALRIKVQDCTIDTPDPVPSILAVAEEIHGYLVEMYRAQGGIRSRLFNDCEVPNEESICPGGLESILFDARGRAQVLLSEMRMLNGRIG